MNTTDELGRAVGEFLNEVRTTTELETRLMKTMSFDDLCTLHGLMCRATKLICSARNLSGGAMLKSIRHGSKLTAKEASDACKTSRLNYLAFERGRYNITRARMDRMTELILKTASNKDKDKDEDTITTTQSGGKNDA